MSKKDNLPALGAFSAFEKVLKNYKELNQQQLDLILSKAKSRWIPKGEFILKEGQSCNFWAFVTTGLVRIFSCTPSGEEHTSWFVREGQLLTEFISFFDERTLSLENMMALEDTAIIYFDREQLQWLMQELLSFDKFCRLVYQSKLIELKRNVLHRIHFDAKERYLYFSENYPELNRRAPLKFIASMLNMTDSSLSRIRKQIVTPVRL